MTVSLNVGRVRKRRSELPMQHVSSVFPVVAYINTIVLCVRRFSYRKHLFVCEPNEIGVSVRKPTQQLFGASNFLADVSSYTRRLLRHFRPRRTY